MHLVELADEARPAEQTGSGARAHPRYRLKSGVKKLRIAAKIQEHTAGRCPKKARIPAKGATRMNPRRT
jgi:hypothetical protein